MNIIIGNGLIAQNMEHSCSDNIYYFCSGVSNSQENQVSEFNREEELLTLHLKKCSDMTFVYFSSVMVNTIQTPSMVNKL